MNIKELSTELNYKIAKLEAKDVAKNLVTPADIINTTLTYNIAAALSMMNKQLYDMTLLLEKIAGVPAMEQQAGVDMANGKDETVMPVGATAQEEAPSNIIKAP